MPRELWAEVHNIVQEAMTQTIPKKNKCKKVKWLSEEALQIAEERRDVKGKTEWERYIQLNAQVQRLAGRDKKAFLNEHCKEIEENNRVGPTRDLFRKIGAVKGLFHGRMSMIKDRNRLIRRAKNTQKNYTKKELNEPDNHDGVVTCLEQTSWSVKSSGP